MAYSVKFQLINGKNKQKAFELVIECKVITFFLLN